MKKLQISQVIIVEGKYDKIKLTSFIDGVIICTNGFAIYKDKSIAQLVRYYAEKTGIIILTDSDTAGFKIRGYLRGICPKGEIINVYIPDIFGKEKRKTAPSKEGKLGVEGIKIEILKEAFEKAGVIGRDVDKKSAITKLDFFELGLSGGKNSSLLRLEISKDLNLPQLINANSLLEVVNTMFERDEFIAYVKSLRKVE